MTWAKGREATATSSNKSSFLYETVFGGFPKHDQGISTRRQRLRHLNPEILKIDGKST
jgi:maltooligosyltrehalose synthase